MKFTVSKIIGLLYLAYFIAGMLYYIPVSGWAEFFWFCNVLMLFCALALILENKKFAHFVLVQSIVAHAFWLSDVLTYLVAGFAPVGIANRIFAGDYGAIEFFFGIRHILQIPLLIWFLHGYTTKLQYGKHIMLIAVLFIISFFFQSVNCAKEQCIGFLPSMHPLLFLAIMASSALVSVLLISHPLTNMILKQGKSIKMATYALFILLLIFTTATWLNAPKVICTTTSENMPSFFCTDISDDEITLNMGENSCATLIYEENSFNYTAINQGETMSIPREQPPSKRILITAKPCN